MLNRCSVSAVFLSWKVREQLGVQTVHLEHLSYASYFAVFLEKEAQMPNMCMEREKFVSFPNNQFSMTIDEGQCIRV